MERYKIENQIEQTIQVYDKTAVNICRENKKVIKNRIGRKVFSISPTKITNT